jgi:putative ABC transport system substrate-binding protein
VNNRRKLIVALGAGALTAPFGVLAQQQGKVWRVGYLHLVSPPIPSFSVIVRVLKELGYAEGKNVHYETRYALGQIDRLPGLAKELVDLKVDVIVAIGNTVAFVAKAATSTIPIVVGGIHGAVETGLVASLSKPGGNITGTESLAPELDAKRLALLREALPKATRFAVINNPLDSGTALHTKWSGDAAAKLGIKLETFSVRSRDELDPALAGVAKMRPDGILLMVDALIADLRSPIVAFALANRLPAIAEFGYFADLGGLLSYGPTVEGLFGGAAVLVDKILKGAKPGELPVERPTILELVVNLKTAKALGITIANSLLVQATKVIE